MGATLTSSCPRDERDLPVSLTHVAPPSALEKRLYGLVSSEPYR